jgi:hypothetical protein
MDNDITRAGGSTHAVRIPYYYIQHRHKHIQLSTTINHKQFPSDLIFTAGF